MSANPVKTSGNNPRPLQLVILGAHPDDAEFHAGGLAAIYRKHGHQVWMISLTNGDAGHHQLRGPELSAIRKREAAAAAAVIGAVSEVWDYPDGFLEPTLDLRRQVISTLRRLQPDLVLTHRTNDYHPDHRAVGHVVRDASYLVTVPGVLPEIPILERMPVICYMPDRFTRPAPLVADVAIDVGGELDAILQMLACHHSQVFEWLPFNRGILDSLPDDDAGRRAWLRSWYSEWLRPTADRYRDALIATYGPVRGSQIQFAEVFEVSEYAAPLDPAARDRLFGFVRSVPDARSLPSL